jgi:hypothetical protein
MTEQTFGGYAEDDLATLPTDADLGRHQAADGAAPAAELSLLDELEAELAQEIDARVRFPVSLRPGWVLEYEAVLSAPQIKRFNDTAKGKGKAENADARVSNGMALIETCVAIYKEREGELVKLTDEDGRDLTLRSTRWLKMFGEPSVNPSAVRALCKFMGDAGVITTGAAVLREAGWAEDLTPLDPTHG